MDEKGRITRRLIDSSAAIAADDPNSLLFQHTVMCQTSLPYRNPGDTVRVWEREQGAVALSIEAGRVRDQANRHFVEVGLPFGPKPRLILAHLSAESLRQGSPQIEVENSLTAFVRRIQGRPPTGPEIRKFRDQLSRLSAATIRLAVTDGARGLQMNTHVVDRFEMWLSDERQRVLWPSVVELSPRFYESLQKHAVPLDERAIAALAHTALGLDLYCWLAQRLHRVKPEKPQFISWRALHGQFGLGYGRVDNFKRVFRQALAVTMTQYGAARLELDDRGMTLHHSPPAVRGRVFLLSKDKGAATCSL